MEEQVGAIWHRLVTRIANTEHQHAMVRLVDVQHTVGVVFRALGGDGGLQVEAADATATNARRRLLQCIAGTHRKVELAWRDSRSLRLPAAIAWFDDRNMNRDLFIWLAAMAAGDHEAATYAGWLQYNQSLAANTLKRFPGLRHRYERLVQAHVQQRPNPETLNHQDQQWERAIRHALCSPDDIIDTIPAERDPFPVPLWLHPDPPGLNKANDMPAQENNDAHGENSRDLSDMGRRQAQRVRSPQQDRGLITIRMENILTWGEFINLDRSNEDEDDLDRAESVARDLDKLSVARNQQAAASRLKFDLDLPSEADDDTVLADGMLLPEWDFRKQQLVQDQCRIVELLATDAPPCELPRRLGRMSKRLRNQFQALAPARVWHKGQADGQEIDLDAWIRYCADRQAGHGIGADDLYREMRSGGRDLACLLLADLSLSTDSWIDDQSRVIDVIKDALFLFAESLNATGDQFAMAGFSSRKRNPVRLHILKTFRENYNQWIRGRIAAIKPGYYTRLGAGIRYATEQLKDVTAGKRLLLILTDGKPNDLDQYEGRYGIEDTRNAVIAARRAGLQPFCVTIDQKGNDYLPHLFGTGGYIVVKNPAELPRRLPLLYAQLTH